MTHVTCRLAARNLDQLRNRTLGSRVWATFYSSLHTLAVRRRPAPLRMRYANRPNPGNSRDVRDVPRRRPVQLADKRRRVTSGQHMNTAEHVKRSSVPSTRGFTDSSQVPDYVPFHSSSRLESIPRQCVALTASHRFPF